MVRPVAAALALAAACSPSRPAPSVRRVEIARRPGTAGLEPRGFARLGGAVLFQGSTPAEGRELWRSDGTPEGTTLVLDAMPGTGSSDPTDVTVVGDRAFFPASDGRTRRIWVTDGTSAGTRPTALFPESDRQSTVFLGAVPGRLTVTTSEPEASVWSSDGAAPATKLLGRACPGPCGVGAVVPIDDRLFVSLFFKSRPGELWRVDGSGEAVLVGTPVRRLVGWSGAGVFFARDDEAGGVWVATGTDARRVSDADVRNGPAGDAAALGDVLLFPAGGGSIGREASELWRSDGTAEGTRRVADPVPAPGTPRLHGLAAAGGRVFFLVDPGGTGAGPLALWASDGTSAGTGALATGLQDVPALVPLGSGVVFQARAADGALGLWRSDGTVAGTAVLAPLAAPIAALTSVGGGDAWFAGPDGQPWRTDGTSAGTRPVGVAAAALGAEPAGLTVLGQQVLLTANDGVHGSEPWRTDGTDAGTHLLADLWSGPAGGEPRGYAVSGGRAWFLDVSDPALAGQGYPTSSVRLHATDGTEAGTVLRRDAFLTSGCIGPPCAPGPVTVGGRALYVVQDPRTLAPQVWADDGTTSAPVPGGALDPIAWPATLGDRLFFVSGDGVFATRGDAIRPLPFPARPAALTAAAGALYLVGEAEPGVAGLFRSDGSETAPVLVRRFPDPRGFASLASLAGAAGRLWFSVDQADTGPEPWVSDGTEAGTVPLGDLLPGPAGSAPSGFAAIGARVVFFADDGAHGREPWVTDGTADGTHLLADLNPGPAPSVAPDARLVPAGPDGPLFFAASDGASGDELWTTDGSREGTRRVVDLAPGARSSSPADLIVLGDTLLLTADHPETGRQLVVVSIPGARAGPLPAPPVAGAPPKPPGATAR
ncbi:hypothetical protein [Anaeromyxobacter oryzae]|uniref:Uncharacterized protein n=1 Tax=Anaeromyxobacter oryzae TaxID=2918170 RepID=A0ABN6MX38_9BACT|nr:hypothetical protein [Anaeromyxobacter oryzae]BDG05547.1 hypothetical protein AMOR_45430 [Anaeromyxobacter oryzae]